jgi:hypothetical protein
MYKPRRDAFPKRHERVLEILVRMSIVPLYKDRFGGEIFFKCTEPSQK